MTSVSCDKRWLAIFYSRRCLEFRVSWPVLLENLSLFLLRDYPILAK